MIVKETPLEIVVWIHLAHDKDRWWAVVKTILIVENCALLGYKATF